MNRLATAFACLSALSAAPALGSVHQQSQSERDWTAEDAASVLEFVQDLNEYPGFDNAGPAVWYSPDKSYFFFVSRKGNLQCDCKRYVFSVFKTDVVRAALKARGVQAPQPLREVTIDNYDAEILLPGRGGPSLVAWSGETTLILQNMNSPGRMELAELDVTTGAVRPISGPKDSIVASTKYRNGGLLIIRSDRAFASRKLDVARYPGQFIRGDYLAYNPKPLYVDDSVEYEVSYRGGSAKSLGTYHLGITGGSGFSSSISPDGKWAVIVWPAFTVTDRAAGKMQLPAGWEFYSGIGAGSPAEDIDDYDRFGLASPEARRRLYRPMLVDMQAGTMKPLLDAPIQVFPRAPRTYWSADSKHVVIDNLNLPLDADREARRTKSYLVDFSVEDGRWTALTPMEFMDETGQAQRLDQLLWLNEGRSLLSVVKGDNGKPSRGVVYELFQNVWKSRAAGPDDIAGKADGHAKPDSALPPDGFRVYLRPGKAGTPEIAASNGKRDIILSRPDTGATGIRRIPTRSFSWPESDSAKQSGLLLLPRNLPSDAPPPLVIQFEETPGEGPESKAAYAAEVLAARGMAVLRINPLMGYVSPVEYWKVTDVPEYRREMAPIAKHVDAAVRELTRRGLIDPKHVGIIGFSRMGHRAYYMLTHPGEVRPSAAIVSDSFIGGYGEYLRQLRFDKINPIQVGKYDAMFGGSFWDKKQMWLEESPTFSSENVHTPVLFSQHTEEQLSMPQTDETFGAMRMLNRPVDMIVLPRGEHQLGRPRQHLFEMQVAIDWMSFWLQGKEDNDPAKADQYRYWRLLKKQQAETPPTH